MDKKDLLPSDVMGSEADQKSPDSGSVNRRIRIFISSTFRDMAEERDRLMTHTWPVLRRFCSERQVELVEVDMRWGIAEEQSTRKETLKLCLDEIRACRPFFIGLLGERYGWIPGQDSFTADLREEQPWLNNLLGKSVTELEILHGVLNNPDMAGRAFFYFRHPAYAQGKGADFLAESPELEDKQKVLKNEIKDKCTQKQIPLYENYPDPQQLADLVLDHLKKAIDSQFPLESIPDPLTKDKRDHEAFAQFRRRVYIGRPEYFYALNQHVHGITGPLALLGDSGSGKSALIANWVAQWRLDHPQDFIFQHYIGGTADGADHWRLLRRLIGEIKKWSNDQEEIPLKNDELIKVLPMWLAKARIRAEHEHIRFIIILDALNQLENRDNAQLLGWFPEQPFSGSLRLISSTLPGPALDAVKQRGWRTLQIKPLETAERSVLITEYLKHYSKTLDARRLNRLCDTPAAANPLYLKILLDELRVTGTHDKLDERLDDYLSATDIPSLLKKVLNRYTKDYDRDRKDLVRETLSLIWAARRGLSETELLCLLKPAKLAQLPQNIWSPVRAALEEGLVDRGGILNFSHDFLKMAVEQLFVTDDKTVNKLRLKMADYFAGEVINARSCDELPWLLLEAKEKERLRNCLLDIDRFMEIQKRDQNELMGYWVWMGEDRKMGKPYLSSFEEWAQGAKREEAIISLVANDLGLFLDHAALYLDAEPLLRRALTIAITEQSLGKAHPSVATGLNNLAHLLHATNRFGEAESLYRRALAIDEKSYGKDHAFVARNLNNLAQLLQATNRLGEAESLYRRALAIDEKFFGKDHPFVARDLNTLAGLLQSINRCGEAEPLLHLALAICEKSLGKDHPNLAVILSNLALLLQGANRLSEAEPLMRRALAIAEKSFGKDHPDVARALNNLAQLLKVTNRLGEAESLFRHALAIYERSLVKDHPSMATGLNNLAQLLQATNRLDEAEPLFRRALSIDELSFGKDHPDVALSLNNLAALLMDTNRLGEAEPLFRRALAICEKSLVKDHPSVATGLNNLAQLLQATNRLGEAEPLMRRALAINELSLGQDHPSVATCRNNLAALLLASNRLNEVEPLIRQSLKMVILSLGTNHPDSITAADTYNYLLQAMGLSEQQIRKKMDSLNKE